MIPSLARYFTFFLSLTAAVTMIGEGCFILLLKKQIIPIPMRILYGLSSLVVGGEKSRQQFLGRTSPKDLRSYAVYVLIFGAIIFISCFVYLFGAVL